MRTTAVGVLIAAALLQVACDKSGDGSSRQAGGGCVRTGDQAERRAVIEFFAAYNHGDVGKAERVSELTELWDPVGTGVQSGDPARPPKLRGLRPTCQGRDLRPRGLRLHGPKAPRETSFVEAMFLRRRGCFR